MPNTNAIMSIVSKLSLVNLKSLKKKKKKKNLTLKLKKSSFTI